MKLIVGLGNPGEKYEKTRHNIGFMVLDELHQLMGFDEFKENKKFEAFISEGSFNDDKLILAKPLTYMNLSGDAVSKIANFYKIDSKDIIVVYDDLDFPFGTIRIKKEGSSGGHNGIKSIIERTGKKDFVRIRVGIGNEHMPREKKSFVLKGFSSSEKDNLINVVKTGCEMVTAILENDPEYAMNKYH